MAFHIERHQDVNGRPLPTFDPIQYWDGQHGGRWTAHFARTVYADHKAAQRAYKRQTKQQRDFVLCDATIVEE